MLFCVFIVGSVNECVSKLILARRTAKLKLPNTEKQNWFRVVQSTRISASSNCLIIIIHHRLFDRGTLQ